MKRYQYYIEVHGSSPEDAYSFQSACEDVDDIAEDAAKDYHFHHDGWEAIWPVVFTILDEHGVELGKIEVDREVDPAFRAVHY